MGVDQLVTGGDVNDPVVDSLSTEKASITGGSILVYNGSGRFVDYVDPADNSNDGDATIQAGIDALTERGGTVELAGLGPNDGVSNGESNAEDNVYAVDTEINTKGKNSIAIEGQGPGWMQPSGSVEGSGTTLIATSAVPSMLTYTGGYLDGLRHIRLDGAGTATDGVTFEQDAAYQTADPADFHLEDVMIHDVTGDGLVMGDGTANMWVEGPCWIERCGGFCINIDGADWFWIDKPIIGAGNTDRGIRIQNSHRGGVIRNIKAQSFVRDVIRFEGGASSSDVNIMGGSFKNWNKDGQAARYAAISFYQDASQIKVYGCHFDGESKALHAIYVDNGVTLTDCEFWGLTWENLTDVPFYQLTGSSNTVRTIVNGVSWNAGNPSTGGDWNGHAEKAALKGVTVIDDTATTPYPRYQAQADGSGGYQWVEVSITAA